MRRFAGFLLCLALLASPLGAKPRKSKKRPPPKPLVYTVTPSDEIEERVEIETALALDILHRLGGSSLFLSAYVPATFYYHDGFLSDFADDKPDADPGRRIVSRIQREITPSLRTSYVGLLLQYWCENAVAPDAPTPAFVAPVPYENKPPGPPPKSTRRRRWARASTHENALDLFIDEGTPVVSATRGVVVVADGRWDPQSPFSTTSQKGGNTVIVFDPDCERFYRYAHLETVTVTRGQIVAAGDRIGSVGHTGLNASRPKHGRHLHFEANQFEDGKMRPLKNSELWALVRSQAPPETPSGTK